MKHINFRRLRTIAFSASLMIIVSIMVQGQYGSSSNPTKSQAGTPTLTATLVDAEKKAQQKAAVSIPQVSQILDLHDANWTNKLLVNLDSPGISYVVALNLLDSTPKSSTPGTQRSSVRFWRTISTEHGA